MPKISRRSLTGKDTKNSDSKKTSGKKNKKMGKTSVKKPVKDSKKNQKAEKTEKNKIELQKKSTIEMPKRQINEKEKKEILELFSDAYARKVMVTLGGENSLEVIRSYPDGMSDEEIARRLKVKISDVRSTLNRMHGEGFVAYTRRKDGETGWYSYSWSLNKKNIFEWVKKLNDEKKSIITPESEKYYCKKCGIDSLVDFAEAYGSTFKCSCCNGTLDFLEEDKLEQLFSKIDPEQIKKRQIP